MNAPMLYIFKCPPHKHQETAFYISRDMEAYGFLFEMGAGKSKPTVDTIAYLYSCGRINTAIIAAPNGVHSKWLKEDVPLSLPDHIEYRGAIWEAGNAKAEKACEDLLKPGTHLRILCINIDSFSNKNGRGYALVKRLLESTDCLMAVDESSRIKNPDAKRTQNICKLGEKAKYRRILSGTYISNSPFDMYGQFMFLDPSILGQSFYAFKSTYAEIMDKNDPFITNLVRKNNLRFAPQIVAKDKETGKPKYRNLDKLKAVIAPYCMRVTKEECLDLPPKIYQNRYFKLPTAHQRMYDKLKQEAKLKLATGESMTVMHKLTLMLRLQQLTSGFFSTDTGELKHIYDDPKDNPRFAELLDLLEDLEGSTIIWCRFIEEIEIVRKLLGDENCYVYYGATSMADREEAKVGFQQKLKKYFVGNVQSGGIGLNLTAAENVVYVSNTFSYEDRKQSEDRAHRIGQQGASVNYFDLLAEGTVDLGIVKTLKNKEDLATYMNDFASLI